MDPATIVSTVAALSKTAYSIGTTLYSFRKAAKTVDETVQGLCAEIDGFTHVLKTLSESLQLQPITRAVLESQSDSSQALWDSIEASLADCHSTVEKLNKRINGVRPDSEGHLRWTQKAILQFKLNLEDEAIKGFRSQLHTHGMALQTILGTVNLYFNIKGPRLVIEELKPRLLELKASLAKIESNQSTQRRSHVSLTSAEEATFVTTEHLRRSAEKVLSSASTIYNGTDEGGTEIEFRYSSEYGEPLNQARREGIEKWIPQPITEVEEEESSTKYGNSSETLSKPPTPVFSDMKQSTRSGVTAADSFAHDLDSDSDTEIDAEFVQKIVDKARAHYSQHCLPEAEAWFQKSLQHGKKLSLRRQNLLGLTEVRLQYASCCFQQKKMVEAEAALLLLATAMTVGDEDRVHVLQASHLLAHLYLRDRQFDRATEFCRKAMIGRRRILGKGHQLHYETLFLLSVIYKSRGDLMEAETYRDMIPVPVLEDLVPFVSVTGDVDFPNPSHEYQEPLRSSHTGLIHEVSCHKTSTPVETPSVEKAKEDIEVTASSKPAGENMELSQKIISDIDIETSAKRTSNLQSLPFNDTRPSEKNENLETGIVGNMETGVQSGNPNARTDSGSVELVASSANLAARAAKGNTPLHVAVVDGDVEAVRHHIRGDGACELLEARNDSGEVPIHLAAGLGKTPIIELLLGRGANINIIGRFSCTPLFLAVDEGHTESVQLLLDHKADFTTANIHGKSPLLLAIVKGHVEIVEMLLDAGANLKAPFNNKPLHLAVNHGHPSLVRLLLDRADTAADINSRNSRDVTPLIYIFHSLSVEVLLMLLDEGADIHAKTKTDRNVLHFVFDYGKTGPAKCEIVRLLLERGADLDRADIAGRTPDHYISRDDKELRDIVKYFKEKNKLRRGLFSRMLSA
ncbi:Ankyrin-2 [Xylographa pallens]|nr:Ankyrin-2 [Xylographa pallens]